MQTLEIRVPDSQTQKVKDFLQDLGIVIKVKKGKVPNADTIAAMEELKAGRGRKFKNAEELFNSID